MHITISGRQIKPRLPKLALIASLALAGALASALPGCGLQPGSATVSYFHSQDAPPPEQALHAGVYGLYAFNSPNPLYTVRLKQGDLYGFRRSADGKVVAFAPINGTSQEIHLENVMTTSYEWRYRKD